jgi:hypothetical protein
MANNTNDGDMSHDTSEGDNWTTISSQRPRNPRGAKGSGRGVGGGRGGGGCKPRLKFGGDRKGSNNTTNDEWANPFDNKTDESDGSIYKEIENEEKKDDEEWEEKVEEAVAKQPRAMLYTVEVPTTEFHTREEGLRRFIEITLQCREDIAILPVDAYEAVAPSITDSDQCPTTQDGAAKYYFERRHTSNYRKGKKGLIKYYSTTMRVEGNTPLQILKQERQYRELLEKWGMYVRARSDGPTVTCTTLGWLKNVNPEQCSTNALITELYSKLVHIPGAYIYVTTRKERVKIQHTKKKYETTAFRLHCRLDRAREIKNALQKSLNTGTTSQALSKVRLIPCYRNLITEAELSLHITQHNAYLHKAATVEIANVWPTDDRFLISDELKDKFSIKDTDGEEEDDGKRYFDVRELLLTALDRNNFFVRDAYYRYGNLVIATTKGKEYESAVYCSAFINECNEAYGYDVFAALCGCNTPKNESRQPVIKHIEKYNPNGQIGIMSTDVTEEELAEFQHEEGIEVQEKVEKEPNLAKPPANIRRRQREPTATDPSLLKATAAETWAKFIQKEKQTQPARKKHQQAPKKTVTFANTIPTAKNVSPVTKGGKSEIEKAIAQMKEDQKTFTANYDSTQERIKAVEKSTIELVNSQKMIRDNMLQMQNSIYEMKEDFKVRMDAMLNMVRAMTAQGLTSKPSNDRQIQPSDSGASETKMDVFGPCQSNDEMEIAQSAGTKRKQGESTFNPTSQGLTKPNADDYASDSSTEPSQQMEDRLLTQQL